MLARLLKCMLAAELAGYLAAGVSLHIAAGWGWLGIVILAAAVALAIRALIVAAHFITAWKHRSPVPVEARMSGLGWIKLFLHEYLSQAVLYTLLQPFPVLAGTGPGRGRNTLPPVVYVHGFFCNRGFWSFLRRGLAHRGVGWSEAVDLEPLFGDIDAYAPILRAAVDGLIVRSGQPRVALICHSIGGLAARSLLASDPELAKRVSALITLGSPHHGTALAWLARGINVREMRPQSTWLQRLNRQPPPAGVRLVSIYSYFDNVVAPQESSRLPGWRNIPLSGPGHLGMAFSTTVLRHLTGEIRAAAEAPSNER